MIKLTKEGKDRVERYIRKPTKEELENRKKFMDGVVERTSKREEIEKELVKSLKKLQNNDAMHISRIIDTIENIQKFIGNVTYEEFKDSDMLISAVILKFEIIGELAKYISEELRNKDVGINWKDLIEYRNYLIENYFDVDLITLWEKSKIDLEELREKLLTLK